MSNHMQQRTQSSKNVLDTISSQIGVYLQRSTIDLDDDILSYWKMSSFVKLKSLARRIYVRHYHLLSLNEFFCIGHGLRGKSSLIEWKVRTYKTVLKIHLFQWSVIVCKISFMALILFTKITWLDLTWIRVGLGFGLVWFDFNVVWVWFGLGPSQNL